ncbi:maestro heat-like repeat family member 5 [Trachemys scripta elegans]|uniref:maestro heat-like repeat family member 5 n=1 Tax=Trachemys scripta elegans TaxID=31138 RepID=UPI001555362E|nr:maestro heat-like repeat family member 5 [Trachemys scripta elegans]
MRDIEGHLQGRAELLEDRAKQLCFLRAIPRLCFFAQQQRRDTLEPHFSKAALVESIAELIENLPLVPEPTDVISSSMAAVCSLSKLKPPLALELESRLLRALMYSIFAMTTERYNTYFQALHNTFLEGLDTMLGCLLTETPTTDKLQHLLEHVYFWLHSKNRHERVRAIRCSAALLQFATSLPGFDTSSDFPKAGNFVLQLGLYISDPANDISQQARSGLHWLQRLLLQRRGLNIQEASHLWCRDRIRDTERLAYRHMARVAED